MDLLERACTKRLQRDDLTKLERIESLRLRAASHWHRKQFKKVIANLSLALRLNPRNAKLQIFMSQAAFRLRYMGLTLTHLKEAFSLAPHDAQLHRHSASVLRYYGREKDALKSVNKALELNPDDPYAHYLKADILVGFDQHHLAFKHTQRLLRLDKDELNKHGTIGAYYRILDMTTGVRVLHARILSRLGRTKEAERIFDDLINEQPTAIMYTLRASFYDDLPLGPGNPGWDKEITSDVMKAIRLDPKLGGAWALLSFKLHEQNHFELALMAINRSIEVSPTDGSTPFRYWEKSRILQDMGDKQKSIASGIDAFEIAFLMTPSIVEQLTNKLRRHGYWTDTEPPKGLTPDLRDAITACRTDPRCW